MIDRTRVKEQVKTTATTSSDSVTEVSRVGIVTIAAFGAIVGLWSVACFVGGMVASGGPLAFIGAWFKAVSGI